MAGQTLTYDVIVLGTGGVGSAALHHLAKRGLKVLGIDRFAPPHDRGSSHGETRVIRKSYFEHPGYVPLLNRAYELWDELAEETGHDILRKTGLVYFGNSDGPVLRGIRTSSQEHGLRIEDVSSEDARLRFPQFAAPQDAACLFEPDGGCLMVENCIAAHLQHAVAKGVVHHQGERVTGWTASSNHCTVTTDKATYQTARLVIAGGAWANELLADLRLPLKVVRKHLHWFEADCREYEVSSGCPCYFIEALGGYFYGCPSISERGFKVAEHSGGQEIRDPLRVDAAAAPVDSGRIDKFARRHLPRLSQRRLEHKTCFYTVTPDEHFIVDHHPEHPRVALAAGLSGHGFKFTSVLGDLLAQMVTGEHSGPPDFLRLRRFGPATDQTDASAAQ